MQQHMNSKELNNTVPVACPVLLIYTNPRNLLHCSRYQTFSKFPPRSQSCRAFLTTNSTSIYEEWFQSVLRWEGRQLQRPRCQAAAHPFLRLLPYISLHSKWSMEKGSFVARSQYDQKCWIVVRYYIQTQAPPAHLLPSLLGHHRQPRCPATISNSPWYRHRWEFRCNGRIHSEAACFSGSGIVTCTSRTPHYYRQPEDIAWPGLLRCNWWCERQGVGCIARRSICGRRWNIPRHLYPFRFLHGKYWASHRDSGSWHFHRRSESVFFHNIYAKRFPSVLLLSAWTAHKAVLPGPDQNEACLWHHRYDCKVYHRWKRHNRFWEWCYWIRIVKYSAEKGGGRVTKLQLAAVRVPWAWAVRTGYRDRQRISELGASSRSNAAACEMLSSIKRRHLAEWWQW